MNGRSVSTRGGACGAANDGCGSNLMIGVGSVNVTGGCVLIMSGGSWNVTRAASVTKTIGSVLKTIGPSVDGIGGGSIKTFGSCGLNLLASSKFTGSSAIGVSVVVFGGAVATVVVTVEGGSVGLGVGGFVRTVSGACVVVLLVVGGLVIGFGVGISTGARNVTGAVGAGSVGGTVLTVVGMVLKVVGMVLKVVGMVRKVVGMVLIDGGKVLRVGREVDRSGTVLAETGPAVDDVIQVDGIRDVSKFGEIGLTAFCSSNQASKFFVYSPVGS